MTKFILRDYQEQCLDKIISNARKGALKQVIVLATGLGKTVIFGHLPTKVKEKSGKKTLILAHREELLDQAADKLRLIDSDLKVDIEQGSRKVEGDVDVVVASVPTLGREGSERIKKFNPEEFGCIIVDECFVAGTKIDGRNIEDIKIGDYVNSFNEKTRKVEKKKVLRLFKNKVKDKLVKVYLDNGNHIVCTPNHPFFCGGRYISAINLKEHYVLTNIMQFANYIRDAKKIYKTKKVYSLPKDLSTEVLELLYGPDLFRRLQKGEEEREKKKSSFTLFKLWEKGCSLWHKSVVFSSKREGILFRVMQEDILEQIEFDYNEQNKQKICLRKNAKKQSYEKSRVSGEDEEKNDWKNISQSRRKWENDETTNKIMALFRFTDRGIRVSNKDLKSKTFVYFLTKLLFSRHRNKRCKISYRGRWEDPQVKEMEVFGQEKDRSSTSVRVVSTEVLERGSRFPARGVCEDGYVYNFEVEGNNNYFANGILVHNCHHSIASTYVNIFRYFGVLKGEEHGSPKLLVGCTATPSRADHEGLDKIFDRITFTYTLRQGIESSYLAPIKAYTVSTLADLTKVHTRMGDFVEKELSEAINTEERNKIVVNSYLDIVSGGKALVFASDVQHTKDLTSYFRGVGVKASCVLGETDRGVRKGIIEDFASGKIKVLIGCGVFTEGFDEPSIEAVMMARPTKSSVLYQQMVGRGTRLCEGKAELKLIDFVDNTGKNSIMSLPQLFGVPKTLKAKKGKDIMEWVGQAEQITDLYPEYPLDTIDDWSEENIEKIVKEIDIFAKAELPEEVKTNSQFTWEKQGEDSYKLQFPALEGIKQEITIKSNMLNTYNIEVVSLIEVAPDYINGYKKWKKTDTIDVGSYGDLSEALKQGDTWIKENKPEFERMFDQKSQWRSNSATEKQISLLKKLGVPIPKIGFNSGQASVLIGRALSESKKRS